MVSFEGMVAVVTGGASGIGRATVERLIKEGCRVSVLDRESFEPTRHSNETDVLYAKVDITDQSAIDDAIAKTIDRWGALHVLVNGAGIGAAGTVAENDDDEWRQVHEVNVLGTVRVIRAALPHLIASRPSVVVNVGSVVAVKGFPNRALYSATKGAVVALTRAMASDHLKDGVRFNSVCPGTTETPWVARLLAQAEDPEKERRALEARQPHGRLVSADEVADAIVYLANPLAGSVNGVSLMVDAGIQSVYTPPGI